MICKPFVGLKWSCKYELVLPPGIAGWRHGQRASAICHFWGGRGLFSGWSQCKARLDKRIAQVNGRKPIAPGVLHDLRRTFITRLNDLGVEPHIIEALVNHASGRATAGVAGVYNRAAYGPQKRAALALWSNHVPGVTGEGRPDDGATSVVPLRKSR
jgi:integrase